MSILSLLSPETGVKVSHWGALAGGVILALSAFTSWYYQRMIDAAREADSDARHREIVTNVPALTAELVTEKVRELVGFDEKRLQSEFPLGYGILSIEGDDWFALPRASSFKWDTMALKAVTAESVAIRLPDYEDQNTKLAGNRVIIPRQADAQFPVKNFGLHMLIRVLSSDQRSLKVLVAATGKPPRGVTSVGNIVQHLTPQQRAVQLFKAADQQIVENTDLSADEVHALRSHLRVALGEFTITPDFSVAASNLAAIRTQLLEAGGDAKHLVEFLDYVLKSASKSEQPEENDQPPER